MSQLEKSRPFPGKTADQLYKAFEPAFKQAGFDMWKKRQIAWLDMAKKVDNGAEIQSNLSARPGNPAMVTLILSSNVHSQEQLQAQADQIWQALENSVK